MGAGSRCCLDAPWGAGGTGSESRGWAQGSQGCRGIVKEPSFPHRGGGCEWDLQTIPGLQPQRQGTTGQGSAAGQEVVFWSFSVSLAERARTSGWGLMSHLEEDSVHLLPVGDSPP